jgi:2-amino-4-hydroxy-6-hydroxymethyldihydropteridine diphosphokinase
MAVRVAIAFGANTGDRAGQIARAIGLLRLELGVLAVSSLYETAPMYVQDQPAFLNGALIAETDLGPLALLRLLKDIEARVGRQPQQRYGPREIDLDLVSYGVLQLRSAGDRALEVPHPRLPERRFVLQPLYDLDPEMHLPSLGPISALLQATEDQAATVKRFSDAALPL